MPRFEARVISRPRPTAAAALLLATLLSLPLVALSFVQAVF
ncbi:hypothetical protein GCM10011324_26430 [Allosediminivita pacifica]|nr:hypothetical protein GCM10011324_26430 [Allosediminivita pacifica]